MISDDERFPLIFEVAEAGALIQRHLGNGAIYSVIEDADEFVDLNGDERTTEHDSVVQAAYLAGVARGLSEMVMQDLDPEDPGFQVWLDRRLDRPQLRPVA